MFRKLRNLSVCVTVGMARPVGSLGISRIIYMEIACLVANNDGLAKDL